MSPSKVLTLMAALLAIVCVVAVGVYVYKQKRDTAPQSAQVPSVKEEPAPGEQAAKPESSPPAPSKKPEKPAEATGGATPQTTQRKLPSFDVVLVEPGGEGVIAGRAEPGWRISIESGGKTVTGVTADKNGEWSVVLKEPLSPGEHALSLSAQSPDGKQALKSAKSEIVAVAAKENEKSTAEARADRESAAKAQAPGAAAGEIPGDKSLIEPKLETVQAEPAKPESQTAEDIPGDKSLIEPKAPQETAVAEASKPESQEARQPTEAGSPAQEGEIPGDKSLIEPQGEERHAAAEPSAGPESEEPGEVPGDRSLVEPGAPKPSPGPQTPPVKIGMVDYEDVAPGKGRMKLDGTSAPGSTVYLYFDDERLAEVTAGGDGKWQFEMEKVLPSGHHQFRAEWYDEATGVLAGRTIVAVERVKPAPELAAKEDEPAKAPEQGAAPVPPESAPPDEEIPGDKSLIRPPDKEQPSLAEVAAQSESAAGILGDKSLIEPPSKEESDSASVASKREREGEIPGDKSLIGPQAAPESQAMAGSEALVTEGESPGNKSLIEPPSKEESDSASVASKSEGEGEVPGDKSLMQPPDEKNPGESVAASEPTPSAETVAKGPSSEPAPAPDVSKDDEKPSEKTAAAELPRPPKTGTKEPAGEPAPPRDVSKGDEKPGERIAAAPMSPMIVRERRTEIYFIKRGDTLWDLAEQYLDGGWRYKRIYRTNRDVIRDPHWIYPDQKLVIPEP